MNFLPHLILPSISNNVDVESNFITNCCVNLFMIIMDYMTYSSYHWLFIHINFLNTTHRPVHHTYIAIVVLKECVENDATSLPSLEVKLGELYHSLPINIL